MAKPGLSKNVYEVVSKSLGDTESKKSKILENKAKLQKRAKTDAFLKREPLKVFVSGANKANGPAHASVLTNVQAELQPSGVWKSRVMRDKFQGR